MGGRVVVATAVIVAVVVSAGGPRQASAGFTKGAALLAASVRPGVDARLAAKPEVADPNALARRLGLGLMVAAPLFASGGLYLRSQAAAPARVAACVGACLAGADPGRARRFGAGLDWALLGAGIASFAGGGLLLWLTQEEPRGESAGRLALRIGRDGRASAVLVGKF